MKTREQVELEFKRDLAELIGRYPGCRIFATYDCTIEVMTNIICDSDGDVTQESADFDIGSEVDVASLG